MNSLPQSHTNRRVPRVRITDLTPVVLRLPDGGCHRGKLETISLTGGLLSLSQVLDRGSHISLVFLTDSGPVRGTAEMLSPVSKEQQPFRFVALERDDQRRLRLIVQPLQNGVEEAWIAKYRAALVQQNRKPGTLCHIVHLAFIAVAGIRRRF